MLEIITSTVINFGDGDGEHAILELDTLLNTYNGKVKTQFSPGDTIYFLFQCDTTKLQLDYIRTTAGVAVEERPSDNRIKEAIHLWEDIETTHKLNYIPNGVLSTTPYGNSVNVLREGDFGLITSSGAYPANMLVSYPSNFRVFKVIAPTVELEEDESWPLSVVAYLKGI